MRVFLMSLICLTAVGLGGCLKETFTFREEQKPLVQAYKPGDILVHRPEYIMLSPSRGMYAQRGFGNNARSH